MTRVNSCILMTSHDNDHTSMIIDDHAPCRCDWKPVLTLARRLRRFVGNLSAQTGSTSSVHRHPADAHLERYASWRTLTKLRNGSNRRHTPGLALLRYQELEWRASCEESLRCTQQLLSCLLLLATTLARQHYV